MLRSYTAVSVTCVQNSLWKHELVHDQTNRMFSNIDAIIV